MAGPPSVLLVLDISALLASRTLEWQEFKRVGTCGLPEAVLEEIQFLCDRAPDRSQEQTAREFTRFWPGSGWQVWIHPGSGTEPGDALSKAARLSQAVAQTAAELSTRHPDRLVVLVANSQPLLARLADYGRANLCGITLSALLQWVRTRQRPPAVTQGLRSLLNPAAPAPTPQPTPGPATGILPSTRRRSQRPGFIVQVLSMSIALLAVAIAGLVAWRMFQPTSFRQFWRQTGLPALPGDSPTLPTKPLKNR